MADGTVSLPCRQQGQGARLSFSSLKDSVKAMSSVAKHVGCDEGKLSEKEESKIRFRRKMAQYAKEDAQRREFEDRIWDFDVKQGGGYYNRMYSVDLTTFDLDWESPLAPMRFTNEPYKYETDFGLCEAINILSVKIACSDIGFPVRVYGTVIARDCIDRMCVYLFRRDEHHRQTINSEDESLVLTGPKRGLALISEAYIETDLKIKDDEGQVREFSKGLLTIKGIARRQLDRSAVESRSLATRLSTVDVLYGFMIKAVEGTVAVEVVKGCFLDGQITAHTTSIANKLVLYDRELYGGAMSDDGKGVIQLTRPVVCVPVKEMLVIVIIKKTCSDGKSEERTITFTPKVNGAEEKDAIAVGDVNMRVKVTWSIMGM